MYYDDEYMVILVCGDHIVFISYSGIYMLDMIICTYTAQRVIPSYFDLKRSQFVWINKLAID